MKQEHLDRFTVCLEKGLLPRLDKISAERGYPSRSQAIGDFIRRAIVKKEWKTGGDCAATISVVYDPADSRPGRGIETLLRANSRNVLSSQTHCLRGGRNLCTVTAAGRPAELQRLADALRALKGVTHGAFSIVSPL
jgi:CopG family nickel-responsive transcriptional regulator